MCRFILHSLTSNRNTVKDRTPWLCFWYTENRSDTRRISMWKPRSNHLIQHLHVTDEAIGGQSKQAPASLEMSGGKPSLNVISHGQCGRQEQLSHTMHSVTLGSHPARAMTCGGSQGHLQCVKFIPRLPWIGIDLKIRMTDISSDMSGWVFNFWCQVSTTPVINAKVPIMFCCVPPDQLQFLYLCIFLTHLGFQTLN